MRDTFQLSPRKLATIAVGLVSAGLLFIIWIFFIFSPYDTISDKTTFWIAFTVWASPLVVCIWALRNQTPKRVQQVFSNVIIGIGATIIGLVIVQNRWSPLHWGVLAAMPGVLAGILIGLDSYLVPRIIRGQIGPGG